MMLKKIKKQISAIVSLAMMAALLTVPTSYADSTSKIYLDTVVNGDVVSGDVYVGERVDLVISLENVTYNVFNIALDYDSDALELIDYYAENAPEVPTGYTAIRESDWDCDYILVKSGRSVKDYVGSNPTYKPTFGTTYFEAEGKDKILFTLKGAEDTITSKSEYIRLCFNVVGTVSGPLFAFNTSGENTIPASGFGLAYAGVQVPVTPDTSIATAAKAKPDTPQAGEFNSAGAATWTADPAATYTVKYYKDGAASPVKTVDNATSPLSLPTEFGVGSYTFTLTSTVRGFASDESAKSLAYLKTEPLAVPVLSLSGSVLSWGTVTNADKYAYVIEKDGEPLAGGSGELTAPATSVDLDTKIGGATGSYTVKVTAKSNNPCYTDSAEASESFTISQLTTPVLSLSGGVFSWDAVTNASKYAYEIKQGDDVISGGSGDVTTPSLDVNSLISTAGSYTVYVKAQSDSYYFTDSARASNSIGKLAAPVLSLSGSTLSWSAIDNAVKYAYEIKQSDAVIAGGSGETTETSLDLSTKISDVGAYDVYVKAVSGSDAYLDSNKSEETYVYEITLDKPSITNVTNRNVEWTSVTNADSYEIEILDSSSVRVGDLI